MEKAGGYLAYLALLADARAYDDLLIYMAGEADAEKVRELKRKAGGDA